MSTNSVIEWLTAFNASFIRMNSEDEFGFHLDLCNQHQKILILCNNIEVNLDNIGAVWFRRGWLNIHTSSVNARKLSKSFAPYIDRHLKEERDAIINFVFWSLQQKPHIGFPHQYDVNKLSVLSLAKLCGLNIPNTIVTNSPQEIDLIRESKQQSITKCIQNNLIARVSGNEFMLNSTCLVDNDFNEPSNLQPYYSLFQHCITKKYELRIFFIFDKYFPAAIFPWREEENIDGRCLERIDDSGLKTKRVCPVDLPSSILQKLKRLMSQLGFQSGSIDMIVTPKNEYVFLEVNPVGQFDYISKRCNFFLEREIASTLIEIHDEKK